MRPNQEFNHLLMRGGIGLSASGGSYTINGDYAVHTFTQSGTFSVWTEGPAKLLVVAAGGNGNNGNGQGGAGGGGVKYNDGLVLSVNNYGVVVGAPVAISPNDTQGASSSFVGIISYGGAGGYASNHNGGSSGDGLNGGSGGIGNGGGGGGAGSVGFSGGAGGIGIYSDISGSNICYGSGGGGGGNGGIGATGAGNGAHGGPPTNAVPYRGGGAGGYDPLYPDVRQGASGVVIISYRFR